jgi:hypothetical protein
MAGFDAQQRVDFAAFAKPRWTACFLRNPALRRNVS